MTEFVASPELETEIEQYFNAVLERTNNYEFRSFILGVKKELHEVEAISYIKRTLGLKLYEHWQEQRSVDFSRAEMQITCHGITEDGPQLSLRPRAAYVYGRYRKLERNISQTRWVQKKRKKVQGQLKNVVTRYYDESIQEILAKPIQKAFETTNLPTFHGMGREDADVLMLGQGRPFVLEVLKPKKRFIDLEQLTKSINAAANGKIEVLNLHMTNHKAPGHIKELAPDKTYSAIVRCEEPIKDKQAVSNLPEQLNNLRIEQRTPQRVSARRADLVRVRHVRNASVEFLDETSFKLALRTQSGTYIKELISSDEGRTTPSISAMIGQDCVCERLDVLDINITEEEVFKDLPQT